jgi:hypothetical protein
MTLHRNRFSGATLAAALALAATPFLSFAQEPAVTPAPAATTPEVLSLTEIESRLKAEGIRVKEIEVKDKVLEVEGYTAQGAKVELIVDRRSGEILSRRADD